MNTNENIDSQKKQDRTATGKEPVFKNGSKYQENKNAFNKNDISLETLFQNFKIVNSSYFLYEGKPYVQKITSIEVIE